MKTKTTDGTTVVVATEQDRRILDRAVDVLIEYGYRQEEHDSARAADEGVQNIRTVIADLKSMAKRDEKPTPPADPKPDKPVPPENEVVKEGRVAPKSAKSAK